MHHLGVALGGIDTSELRTSIQDTIAAVVIEQPHKIPLLAGAIQIANFKTNVFGLVVVQMVHSKIQQYIQDADYRKLKNFVRFLVCLGPIVEGDGIHKLLEQLVSKANELQDSNPQRDATAQEIVVAVLLALPIWINSIGPSESNVALANGILDLCNQFEIKTAGIAELLTPFVDSSVSDTREFITLVRTAVQAVSNADWKTEKLIGVSSMVSLLVKEEDLQNAQKHSFPSLDIPEQLTPTSNSLYTNPRLILQIYLPSILETVPPVTSYEGVLLRDIATDIITCLDFNRREVTRQLITLDLFFSSVAFAEPGISMERLQTVEQGKSTWKVEDTALEIVLEHIFRLPLTQHPQVYYHAILIDACIMAPQAIAPVFGRAIRFLYNHLEEFDLELNFRFLEWFSHHLSNFGFTWKWQEWKDGITLDDLHPRKVFMQQLVLKEMRLSYPQRIKDTLPEELVSLVPSIPEEPTFQYLSAESGLDELVQALITGMRESKPAEYMQTLVDPIKDKITEQSVGSMAETLDKKLIDVLFTTVCHLGSRSLTHADTWIGRTKNIIKQYASSAEDQKYAIESIRQFWAGQPMVGLLVVRTFTKHGVIDNSSLLNYLLDSSTGLLFTAHGWESFLYLLDGYQEEDDKDTFAHVLQSVSDNIKASADSTWKLWWYKRIARALVRRYHKIISSVDVASLDSEITQFVEKVTLPDSVQN